MKDIAPSDSLRKWFNHDPKKWKEFRDKYFDELSRNKKLCYELINWGKSKITLIYSAKDEEHNNAVLLQEYLEKDFKKT